MRNSIRILPALALTGASALLGACTPEQVSGWLAWHDQDPAAAEAYANAGCDGQCEPAAPEPEVSEASSGSTVWDQLAQCESGGDWSINTGNGYYGGLQFSLESWQGAGGTGYPHEHSREEQIARAEILLDMQGWGAWPTCSAQLGLS